MSDGTPEPEELVGRVLAGRFRILEAIGQGGAGRVFLGVQQPLGRTVAIKVLREDLEGQAHEEFTARFEREAAVAGRLNHPNIVTVHDYGTTADGLSFVVMERLTGPTLTMLVKGGQVMEPGRTARLVADLAKGLAAAHEAGLVHRDVKPHNVIVQEEDGRERPVLLDFGLVKVLTGPVSESDFTTRAGTYMGTPAYMAPEQARGEAMDHRVDIYSLGCMMYRMLTGKIPFTAEHPLGMAVQHMTQPFPPMGQRAPEVVVPARLEAITRRCMEKDPDDRYPDCRVLVADLDAWLRDSERPAPNRSRSGVAVGASVGAVGAGLGLIGVGIGIAALLGAVLVVVALQPVGDSAMVEVPPAKVLPAMPEPVPEEPAPVPEEPAPVPEEPAPVPEEPVPEAPSRDPRPTEPSPAPPPAPSPEPLPMPQPTEPLPAPAPQPSARIVVDEIAFTPAQARRALDFVNQADADALRDAGIYNRGISLIIEARPFESIEAFGATRGIGPKTVEAVADASK